TYKRNDPSARSTLEIILTYPGFWAIIYYRIAHFLHKKNLKLIARMVSSFSRWVTGVEIHPAAQIGKCFFIDHGMGIVIGETAVIGDDVKVFHGVTLGGRGDESGKRHPTIEDGVMLSAHVQVIGNVTVGKHAKIGAGAVVLSDIPEGVTAVGIPAKVVKSKTQNLEEHPDCKLN
ncbi:MAG: serine O-acetyltransferase EpsC, partial [Alkalibacterium sp.]